MSQVRALLLSLLVVALLAAAPARAAAGDGGELMRYARATWASLSAMTDPQSGLPADSLDADGTTSVQTSTTNIGAYMWSAVAAERLGIVSHRELVARLTKTIATLERMERHQPSGQFYNWYDHSTGAKLTVWPPTGAALTPILSSVDNGWLATGLRIVARSVPELSQRAQALCDGMDFGFYYRPDVNRVAFYVAPDTGESPCCYWGFSPSNTLEGGYNAYGVDGIGMNPTGYPSNEDNTYVDNGFPGCPGRDPQPPRPASAYTNGVVTPHAAFLAVRFAPEAALGDLESLAHDFPGLYTRWGFRDSVNVDTGTVSNSYLSLDQGMIMAAIGNALGGDILRKAFAGGSVERTLRPVIAPEQFGASAG